MEKNLNICMLMDFYGQLLTDKQRMALDYYYNDDLSLGEIADQLGISRQGVRDFIKRGEKQLEELESKLSLAGRFISVKEKMSEIENLADDIEKISGRSDELERLKKLISSVSQML